MKIETFEDLIVWQKAHQLTLAVYRITKNFPEVERFGLISQIRRSSASICANIAEGHTKTTQEFVRFLEISRGSLQETKYHLILSRDLGYCSSLQFDSLWNSSNEVGKMIYSLIKSLRN